MFPSPLDEGAKNGALQLYLTTFSSLSPKSRFSMRWEETESAYFELTLLIPTKDAEFSLSPFWPLFPFIASFEVCFWRVSDMRLVQCPLLMQS